MRLEQVSLDYADDVKKTLSSSGEPLYFAITGQNIELIPTPDSAYTLEIIYYTKITALSSSNTSNWLLEDHNDAYLFGTLVQAEPWLMNDERIGVWGALLSKSLEEIRTADDRAEASTGPLIMRTSNNLEYGNW